MPNVYFHNTPTDRGIIINNAAISPGSDVISVTTVDNDTYLDLYADFLFTLNVGNTPTFNPFLDARVLYSYDGATYDDPEAASRLDLVPLKMGTYSRLVRGVPIDPYRFKLYVKNASDVSVTVTVAVKTRRMALQ